MEIWILITGTQKFCHFPVIARNEQYEFNITNMVLWFRAISIFILHEAQAPCVISFFTVQ